MYVPQYLLFLLLFCLKFLSEKSIFHSPIYICVAFILSYDCTQFPHIFYCIFAFPNPYLEFSPVNWHVGLSVGTVESKNKKANFI
jgi:hypothetical protein